MRENKSPNYKVIFTIEICLFQKTANSFINETKSYSEMYSAFLEVVSFLCNECVTQKCTSVW